MSNSHRITLSTEQDTPLQFEAELKGSNEDATICLYIKNDKMCFGFECTHEQDNQWSVTVPALDQYLGKGRYDFCLCVYIDKYCFTPVEGKARITNGQSPRVSLSNDTNKTVTNDNADDQQADDQSTELDAEPEQQAQQPIEQNEAVNDRTTRRKLTEQTYSFFSEGGRPGELAERIRTMPVTNETDKKVRKILEGYKRKHK